MTATPVLHHYDAGDKGCGEGLAREFASRLREVPVGDLFEVTVRDPAAKHDLPALARMIGQRIATVEEPGDGRLVITLEVLK